MLFRNEQQCSTRTEQECSSVPQQQCSTVIDSDQDHSTYHGPHHQLQVMEQECSTTSQQQCSSVPQQQCSTNYVTECSGGSSGGLTSIFETFLFGRLAFLIFLRIIRRRMGKIIRQFWWIRRQPSSRQEDYRSFEEFDRRHLRRQPEQWRRQWSQTWWWWTEEGRWKVLRWRRT